MPTTKHFVSRQEQRRLDHEARQSPFPPDTPFVRFSDLAARSTDDLKED